MNIWFSTCFQLIGGLIILWILSLNIGIITKTSLLEAFSQYFKRCPLFFKARHVLLNADSCVSISSLSADVKITPGFKSIEEKVDYLHKEIERLENEISKSKAEAKESIKESEGKLRNEIKSVKAQIEETNSKIKNIVAGGAKWEVLGALNISYGLLIPVLY